MPVSRAINALAVTQIGNAGSSTMCNTGSATMKFQFAVIGMLMSSLAGFAADKPLEKEKTFDARVERVYAAMVQSVGSTLRSAVKEACTVTFVSSDRYTTWAGTGVCHERGNGPTLVTLSLQYLSAASRQKFLLGGARDKVAKAFWSNVDAAL